MQGEVRARVPLEVNGWRNWQQIMEHFPFRFPTGFASVLVKVFPHSLFPDTHHPLPTSVHINVENSGKKETHSDGAEKNDNDDDDDRLRLPCDEA